MIVIIANKLKDDIESSPIKEHNYRCATGYYNSINFVDNIRNLEIDKLIIDISAIRNVYEMGAWKHFKDIVDPSNIYILLDDSIPYSNIGFLSMLITLGIYNFARSTTELVNLLENPNTYKDVEKYQKMAMNSDDKRENAEEKIEDYERKTIEHQEMMQDYMKKYQEGEFKEPKKIEFFKDQLITGFITLPILTIISTIIFYLFSWLIYNNVSIETNVGKYLYTNVLNSPFNPIVIIGLLISSLIFIIYYNILDPKIKIKQMTRGKFMVLPFAIFCAIIFGDFYLFEIFDKLFNNLPVIATKTDFLYQNYAGFNVLVAMTAILIYYSKIAIANSKVLKFETDLSQKYSIIELLFIITMTLLIGLPIINWLFNFINANSSIYKIINSIYEKPFIMSGLSILTISFTAIMIGLSIMYPNKEVVIKKKEEF